MVNNINLFLVFKADCGNSVECGVWFGKSRTALPRPFRLLCFEELGVKNFGDVGKGKKRQRSLEIAHRDIFKEIREERKWYKNLRIHLTDLSSATSILDLQRHAQNQLIRAKPAVPTKTLGPDQTFRETPNALFERFHSGAPQESEPTVAETELRLREILAQILDITPEEIGKNDSFIRMGGDSLSAMQMMSRARKHGIHLTMRNILQLAVGQMAATAVEEEGGQMHEMEPFSILPSGKVDAIKSLQNEISQ